jgi:hypothetical protein
MAVDAATFVASFPEFEEIYDLRPAVVENALTEATTFCDAVTWGTRYQSGVFRKAAHLLCMSAFGENARISGDKDSVHGRVFDQMLLSLPIRIAVAGCDDF